MSLQLLGNGDPSRDEPEVYVQRWQNYIESFTSVRRKLVSSFSALTSIQTGPTQGIVASKLKRPFLKRYKYLDSLICSP